MDRKYRVIQMFRRNKTYDEIQRELHIGRDRIAEIVAEYCREEYGTRVDTIIEMRSQNVPIREIAKRTGVPRRVVEAFIRRQDALDSHEHIEEIQELHYMDGMSEQEISRTLNLPITEVMRAVRNRNRPYLPTPAQIAEECRRLRPWVTNEEKSA